MMHNYFVAIVKITKKCRQKKYPFILDSVFGNLRGNELVDNPFD